jgi:hypothetical protein
MLSHASRLAPIALHSLRPFHLGTKDVTLTPVPFVSGTEWHLNFRNVL